MKLTPAQLKGRLKNLANQHRADARTLMRLYMMERFLERIAVSEYRDNFIISGLLNTRMRDFYDLYELFRLYCDKIDIATFKTAFTATCAKRDTKNLLQDALQVITNIQQDNNLMTLWKSYQKKYIYAANISYNDIMLILTNLCELMKGQ